MNHFFATNKKVQIQQEIMYQSLDALGNPQKKIKNIIHIAGTNGKGSTANFIKSILEQKYSVNLFTSPHLINFNERFYLKGKHVSDVELKEVEHYIKKKITSPLSYFETATLIAIELFARNQADFNIFEVGIGGKLDSTNIFDNTLAAVITSISYDHVDILGSTIEEISRQKAGIIKNNSVVFTSNKNKNILNILSQEYKKINSNSQLFFSQEVSWLIKAKKHRFDFIGKQKFYSIKNITTPLAGNWQYENCALAIAVCQYISYIFNKDINENVIKTGITNTFWPARLQEIKLHSYTNSKFFLDGAHNKDAVRLLCKFISQKESKSNICIFNCLEGKDFKEMFKYIKEIKNLTHFILLQHKTEGKKYINPQEIISITQRMKFDKLLIINNLKEIKEIIPDEKEINIYIFGSLYFCAEILKESENLGVAINL
jgi:dihydrofolate synthase/folylpolyglutamate synthase